MASEESGRLGAGTVGVEHVLLGLLREEHCAAAEILRVHGANLERIRQELAAVPYEPTPKEAKIRRTTEILNEMLATAGEEAPLDLAAATEATSVLEHYTERARRSIFFARYEATRLDSPMVETEHLLLGVLREDRAHQNLFLPVLSSKEAIRTQIEKGRPVPLEKVPVRTDLPLSDECKQAQTYAEEEAALSGSKDIGPEHLLLGLLREEGSLAAKLLRENGAEIERIRIGLAGASPK